MDAGGGRSYHKLLHAQGSEGTNHGIPEVINTSQITHSPHDYCQSMEYSTVVDHGTEDYEDLLLNEDYRFSELQAELDL